MNEHSFSDWSPIFPGVDRAIGTADSAFDVEPPTPRKQYVNAVRIELGNPALRFKCTAGSDQLTAGDTVTSFMRQHPDVKLAFNASFSCLPSTHCTEAGFPIFGLAAGDGKLVSDPSGKTPCGTGQFDVPDNRSVGAIALVIDENRRAKIQVLVAGDPLPPSLHAAIAGSPQPQAAGVCPPAACLPLKSNPDPLAALYLLDKGGFGIPWPPEPNPVEEIAARTTVGIDDTYLYVLTIDGRAMATTSPTERDTTTPAGGCNGRARTRRSTWTAEGPPASPAVSKTARSRS